MGNGKQSSQVNKEDMMAQENYNEIRVGIADLKVVKQPDRLITLGLGSCVGVSLYDAKNKISGLLHLMLPDSAMFDKVTKKAKFADLGIPLLVSEMRKVGADPLKLTAKLVGGAQMFSGMDKKLTMNIGERNVEKAKEVLKSLGIRITAEDVGGNKGRTMIVDSTDGKVYIRTLGKQQKVI